ncbi:energy-coupling factor transporter transmembrane component T family protein [Thorsellia kenyensis]|uniref:Energy-coupling factor transporter transmembrane component T family protein n=1 Tax=Thorsellia kenyensis TaxID=1549888 RepID=A0ABV6CDZ6_9GAMM
MLKKSDRSNWLYARNPTIKFFVLLMLTFSAGFIFAPWSLLILWFFALLGFYLSSSFSFVEILRMQTPFLWVSCVIFMVNCISRPGNIIASVWIFNITSEGMIIATALVLRTLFIGAICIAFIKSTCPNALMQSLNQHAKLSIRVSYAVMTGFRIVQLLSYDWQVIVAAQRSRHITLQSSIRNSRVDNIFLKARIYKKAILSLMVSAIRRSERIAYTLESKGLGRVPKTYLYDVPLTSLDYLFALMSVGVILILLLVEYI